MKIPIEFVEYTSSQIDLSDNSLPAFNLKRNLLSREKSTLEVLSSISLRLSNIDLNFKNLSSILYEDFFESFESLNFEKLIDYDVVSLNNKSKSYFEIAASISTINSDLEKIYSLYSDIDISYLEKSYTLNNIKDSIKSYNTSLKYEIDNLYNLNTELSKYSAFSKYNDFSLSFKKTAKIEEEIRILKEDIDFHNDLYKKAFSLAEQNYNYSIETSLLVASYECITKLVSDTLNKFINLYDSLYSTVYKNWIRVLNGDYVREGENIYFNRECGKIFISALSPNLPDCDPIKYLQAPPPQFILKPGPEPECITCPPTPKATCPPTTTPTPTAPIPTTTNNNEGSGNCVWPLNFTNAHIDISYDSSESMQSGNRWNKSTDYQIDVSSALINLLKLYTQSFSASYAQGNLAGSSVKELKNSIISGINSSTMGTATKSLIIRIDDSEDATYPTLDLSGIPNKSMPTYVLHIRLLEDKTTAKYSNVFKITSAFLDSAVTAGKIDCWATKAYSALETPADAATNIMNDIKALVKP